MNSGRMPAAAAILTLALGMAVTPAALIAQETSRQITVIGTGAVEAAPDTALVTAGVETQSEAAAEALAGANAAITSVFAVLEDAGVARPDIQTSQLSLEPVWQQPDDVVDVDPRVVGYRASNIVTIRVRAVDRLGAVIDALTRAGANRILGIAFEIADPRPLLEEARGLAIADARTKAAAMSEAAGVTLGPVHSIREVVTGGGPIPFNKAALAMDIPMAQGTVGLTAEVVAVFGLE